MSVKLVNAKTVSELLTRLIDEHSEIHVAVAWGYNGPLADCLFCNKEKFSSITFGLAFCQTEPDLIDRLVGTRNTYVANSEKGIFHPKLYYFRTGDIAEAIVGSSNFTNGGFGYNHEVNIHVKGPSNAPVFDQIRAQLSDYAKLRRVVTKDLAEKYRLQFNVARTLRIARHPVLPCSGLASDQPNSPLVSMTWNEYVDAINASAHHNIGKSLNLLRAAQSLFARERSFADLSIPEWKAIAGTIGQTDKIKENLNDHEWSWFGSMQPNGNFKHEIVSKNVHIAHALDSIPRHGEVTLEQYKDFCTHFLNAFNGYKEVSTATRLLAMKRPDTFVCVSKGNKAKLSQALQIGRKKLNLTNYWEQVIEPIRLSAWHSSPRPSGELAELWDGRTAMLDAVYYEQSQK